MVEVGIRLAATFVAAALLIVANPAALSDGPAERPVPSVAPLPSGAPSPTASQAPTQPPPDYLLMPRAELQALPVTGSAWRYVVETANSAWPPPDINDQDSQTDTLALAAALVYARTGDPVMRDKARDAIMAVIPTFEEPRLRSGLGPLRQTAGWVLAADFIDLDGPDDAAFRRFLERLLTEPIGRHTRWNRVVATHDDSSNNWGAWAGATRIAASLYLGRDVRDAVETVRGFLGDRRAWDGFNGQKDRLPRGARPWACDPSRAGFTPVNGACERAGANLDGAVPADISRGRGSEPGSPSATGVMYTLETLAGYTLQAELLYRNGYPDVYEASDQALRRMADFISRSEAAGGPGWNPGRVQYHVPWLLNRRYGTDYPTVPAEYGRAFGYTDWLYGDAR
ncbi:MAG: hypothetical protein FIA92_17270 [Chloroflexi bacterium]|nr:hypothetical protein [Chloroflexota bacterium]